MRVPDPRIFIYDSTADVFLEHPVGKNRVPVTHSWEANDPRLLGCETVPQLLSSNDAMEPEKEDPHGSRSTRLTFCVVGNGEKKVLLLDTVPCVDEANGGSLRMPVALVVPYV